MEKKIVVLASGEGSRLMPLTKHVPKVLVNLGQETLLKKIYDSYSSIERDEFILVIDSKYNSLVQEYIYQFNLDITILNVDEPYGTAYTLSQIHDSINGCNVLLNWCDVIPEFDNFKWNQNIIYTSGNESRYNFVNGNIVNEPGNIVGIYQLKNINVPKFLQKENCNEFYKGRDFINHIFEMAGTSDFKQIELPNLVDVGELDKFKKVIGTDLVSQSRYFNDVEILDNIVIKRTTNIDLQELEVKWLSTVTKNAPNIVKYTPGELIMERVYGTELYKCFEPGDVQGVLDSLEFSTYSEVPKNFADDLFIETVSKSQNRLDSIYGYLLYVNDLNIENINLVQFNEVIPIKDINILSILEKANLELTRIFGDTKYTIIHGDPNFSNILKTDSGYKFIDPRGYFGNTKILGPKFYDEAKVLYALSGYDKFNHNNLWAGLDIKNGTISINIEPLINISSLNQFNNGHYILLGIIWMNLGGYFKNNPTKAISSFYYGLGLLIKYMLKYKD